jgi:hypothetical protein
MLGQEKRAEEADDDLVNHEMSENNTSADNSPRAYALAA